MDISSKNGYPSSALSNFAGHRFTIDGVECFSMEGFLQSLKFDKEHIQVEVCKLVGFGAKKRGSDRNKHWKLRQKLWWKGATLDRHGDEYQELLERAFSEMAAQSEGFRKALLASGDATLTHAMGNADPHDTVLTRAEFCGLLTRLRRVLKEQ
jgi:hypothetical protein